MKATCKQNHASINGSIIEASLLLNRIPQRLSDHTREGGYPSYSRERGVYVYANYVFRCGSQISLQMTVMNVVIEQKPPR